MPTITEYMNYMVWFRNESEYNTALTLGDGSSGLIKMAPRQMAAMVGIPYPYPSGGMDNVQKGITFYFPFTPGQQIGFPEPTGVFVDDSIPSQFVHGQGGTPANIWPPGPDCNFVWCCSLVKMGGAGSSTVPEPGAIARRRWIIGGEAQPGSNASSLEGGGFGTVSGIGRTFSRTIDGNGWGVRGQNLTTAWHCEVNQAIPGLTTSTSWERFYFRLHVPTSNAVTFHPFWRCGSANFNVAGVILKVNNLGEVVAHRINASANDFPIAPANLVFTPDINRWYKIDIFIKYAAPGGTGKIRIFVDSIFAFEWEDNAFGALNAGPFHGISELGRTLATGSDNFISHDVDDWINADLPTGVDPLTLEWTVPAEEYPYDWLLGSHIKPYYITSPLTSAVDWAPNGAGLLNQSINPNHAIAIKSSTALARLEGLVDIPTKDIIDTPAANIGIAAIQVMCFGDTTPASDAQIGYKLAGGPDVLTTVTDNDTDGSRLSAIYSPVGKAVPDEVFPFSVVNIKSNDANLSTRGALNCVAEYLGVWGPEDNGEAEADFGIPRNFLHNCRYANTPWGYFGAVSAAPVYTVVGTYIGNGTYQEIELPAPAHFMLIRGNGVNGGIQFHATMLEGHDCNNEELSPGFRIFSRIDGSVWFAVSGNNAGTNQNGISYYYCAFCDPGGRFSHAGAFCHQSVSSSINLFSDPDFNPTGMFVSYDRLAAGGGGNSIYFRGPANLGIAWSELSGGAANGGTFGLGVLNSEPPFHSGGIGTYSYLGFRISEPGCAGVMVQICSYTGNGVNPRTIPITPVSGRYPAFVMVIPHTDPAYYRDAYHVGGNSASINNHADAINAITNFGVDSIEVGINCNQNGIVYHILAFPGDFVGPNPGIFWNPICESPNGGKNNPVDGTSDINIISDGGIVLGGETGAGTPVSVQKDLSGIYTLVPDKRHDTLLDRLPGQANLEKKIPNPFFKTGYIGG